MKLVPDNPACEECDSPATIHLRDTHDGTEHLYCGKHNPNCWPDQNQHLEIQRFRMPPNNYCSCCLAANEDSPEHQSLRIEMCELWMLGGEGACRYYLSRLTNSDQFALWSDEFLDNVREYIIQHTQGAAACFPVDLNTVQFMVPFLKCAYLTAQSGNSSKQARKDRAVVLLLQHPSWSDEQIAENVPTTVKQLQRNSNYTNLKWSLKRKRVTQSDSS